MTRITFEPYPSRNTPRTAENLNKLNNLTLSPTEPTTGEEVWIEPHQEGNLFTTTNSTTGSYLNSSNTSISEANWNTTDYIDVIGGNTYYISASGAMGNAPSICFYKSDKTFISGIAFGGATSKEISVPSNACYTRISYATALVSSYVFIDNTKSKINVKLNDSYINIYNKDNMGDLVVDSVTGKNLLVFEPFIDNAYYTSEGVLTPFSTTAIWRAEAEPNTTYTTSFKNGSQNATYRILAFNGDTFISQITFVAPNQTYTKYTKTFTTPANTTNIRISYFKDCTERMIEIGSTATDYVPFTKYGYNEDTNMGKLIVERISGKNLFDKNTASVMSVYINTSNNQIATSANGKSTYIKCKPNTTYTISKQAGQAFRWGTTATVPAVGTSVIDTGANHTASSITLTTGATANYLVVYFYNSDNDTVTLQAMVDSIQIEIGEQATSYQNFNETQLGNIVVDDVNCKNMFDINPNNIQSINGCSYIIENNQSIKITNSAQWANVRYQFDTIVGQTYTVSADFTNANSSRTGLYIFDSEGNAITNTGYYTSTSGYLKISFTATTTKTRIALYSNGSATSNNYVVTFSNIQLEQGSEATSYTPYKSFDSTGYVLYSGSSDTTFTLNDSITNYDEIEVEYTLSSYTSIRNIQKIGKSSSSGAIGSLALIFGNSSDNGILVICARLTISGLNATVDRKLALNLATGGNTSQSGNIQVTKVIGRKW